MSTFLPDSIPGLKWQNVKDLLLCETLIEEIVDLLARIEKHDQLSFRTVETDLNQVYSASRPWQATIARDRQGKIVAYAQIRLFRGEIRCWGGVDPQYRSLGIGRAILEWVKAQATSLLPGGNIRFVIEKEQQDFSNILNQAGFEIARIIQDLRRDLSEPITEAKLDFPLSLQPWNKEYDELLRRSTNRMLMTQPQENFAKTQHLFSPSEWEEAHEGFTPECSFIILDKSTDRWEIAGYSFASIYTQDWQIHHHKQGYIDMFAVFPQWSDTNCGLALMNQTLSALKAQGMNSVASSLYQEKDSAMGQIYLDTGFSSTNLNVEYVWELKPKESA